MRRAIFRPKAIASTGLLGKSEQGRLPNDFAAAALAHEGFKSL
jgi:hypothetical protein